MISYSIQQQCLPAYFFHYCSIIFFLLYSKRTYNRCCCCFLLNKKLTLSFAISVSIVSLHSLQCISSSLTGEDSPLPPLSQHTHVHSDSGEKERRGQRSVAVNITVFKLLRLNSPYMHLCNQVQMLWMLPALPVECACDGRCINTFRNQ